MFLFGVINEAWLNERSILISGIKKKPAGSLSGDGRCDSPGQCAKYMIYSILDEVSNKVDDMEICQCAQAGNSNRMEKFAFVKVVNRLKNGNIKIGMFKRTGTLKLKSISGRKKKISITSSMSGVFART